MAANALSFEVVHLKHRPSCQRLNYSRLAALLVLPVPPARASKVQGLLVGRPCRDTTIVIVELVRESFQQRYAAKAGPHLRENGRGVGGRIGKCAFAIIGGRNDLNVDEERHVPVVEELPRGHRMNFE